MNLENTWQQDSGSDDMLNRLLQQDDFTKINSKLPLKKLKHNLLIGIVWAVIISILYLILIFYFRIWQVQISLGMTTVFNVWVIADSWRLYNNTSHIISPSISLKQELQRNYDSFKKWWRIQLRISLFIFPVAVTGGFILGGVLGSGRPVSAFLYKPKVLLVLGITIAILVPLCYYLAKWMYSQAYGKHLKKLKALIDELTD